MKKIIFFLILILTLSLNNVFIGNLKADEMSPDLDAILNDFDQYAQKTQKQWNIPGMAICIVADGKVVYKKAFGVKKVNTTDKVDLNTVFQLASCTKGFTSALTAMLVDLKYMQWDDKVIKYIPSFRLYDDEISDNITIEDILAQYSGLPDYSQHLMMLFDYDKKDIINSMRFIRPVGNFKEKYSYQNNMYLLAGEIIERVTGKTWETNIKNLIFKPLNMKNSTTDYKSYIKSKNRSVGHYYSGGKLRSIDDSLPYNNWPYILAPASGINSTINDISKWLLFLINDAKSYNITLITEENFNKLFENKIFVNKNPYDKTKNNYYCLGWRKSEYVDEEIIWHAGSTDGEGSYIAFIRDKKIGIAILMNLPNGRMADALSKRFFDSYLQNPETNWSAIKLLEAEKSHKSRMVKYPPENPVPALDLKEYTGLYQNILYGIAEVKLENGDLMFSAGAKRTWIKLKHFNAHTFDGVGVPGWRFKSPMFIFRVYEQSNVNGLIVENMTDGVETIFRKIK